MYEDTDTLSPQLPPITRKPTKSNDEIKIVQRSLGEKRKAQVSIPVGIF